MKVCSAPFCGSLIWTGCSLVRIWKKKVLIAAGILTPAHLYIWDEPLNYIDVFSRMQIEQLILRYRPAMLAVEHDERFQETVGTGFVDIGSAASVG